ncbi:Hypothetical predicted protein [Paramuricea clavata]|uniref:Uncharacterized protein n=1 Tax=Paramuricea clavata TaxID=317549 RepID=A0A6S7GDY2_PARCT|nr:Hypothetical predicted protein [Paramuricea clavata]
MEFLADNGCSGIAYADEPLADEAWLETYHKEEQERLEVEEKLVKKLSGSVYKWGNCSVELLHNSYECCCCSELEGCEEAMHNEEVLEDQKAADIPATKCITQHPGFNCFCLQKQSLKMSADGYKTKKIVKDKIILYWHLINCCPVSGFLRSVSYRGFTRMVYRFLGNKRIPLPACAYTAIRKTFPVSEKEEVTGYIDESD